MDMQPDTNEDEDDLLDEVEEVEPDDPGEVEEVDLGGRWMTVNGKRKYVRITERKYFLPPRKCPLCEEEVEDDVEKCPHCGMDLDIIDVPTPLEVEEVDDEDDEE